MPINKNPIYSIKQSEYASGGFKIKRDSETVGQVPTLEGAVKHCRQIAEYSDFETVIFTNDKGEKTQIDLFED